MDSQSNPSTGITPDGGPVNSTGPIANSGYVSNYASDMQMYPLESLEVHEAQSAVAPEPMAMPKKFIGFSGRKAMVVSLLITVMVMFITGSSMLLLVRNGSHKKSDKKQSVAQQDVLLNGVDKSQIPKELQGTADSLLVNGDVITRGNFKVSNGSYVTVIRVQDATADQSITLPNGSGTICLDSNNCGFAGADQLTAFQGQLTALQDQLAGLGQITIPPAGVAELNSQKGSVTIQGSLNQVAVNTSGGVITLSTPQSLDANANVQFGNLALSSTGTIRANKFMQTGAGNSIDINAGSDMITFTAGGRVFQLPAAGVASQTICTSSGNCGGGGGTPVLLAPGSAQADTTADASIFINDTGGGHLLELQSGGVDKLTVTNGGNVTIAGSLTVAGLGNGFVKSTGGTLSVVNAVNLASADVTGMLPVANGGTGAATAGVARTNLGAAASGANGDITSTTALNTITPSGALTIGVPGQSLSLQGSASTILSAGSGANVTTLNFAAPLGVNTLTLPALTGTICVSTGNCPPSGPAGGDLTGTYPNPTIAKLQGSTLTIGSLAAGHMLIYNATNGQWENHAISGDVTVSETGVATIANNAVTNAKIADNAVTTTKIADGNVTNAKLAGNSVDSTKIADGTVTGTDIANGTVANGNLVNSSLTVTAGNGLSGGGAVSLGASTSLDVVYGSAANTAVQGNTAITITAGTGLTGGGNITLGAGGSSTLNVAYGSSAGTAVEGNTQLTCASGTGNLSGGGNVITLGAGGTCGALTITNSPIFSGTLAVQGATATIGADGQQGSVVLYNGASGASAHTGSVQVIGSLAQDTTYILPDPAGASATICLNTGNCAGAGGGVTTVGGTNGKIARFTGSNTIADSTLSESGSTVTATGNVVIQGSNSLSLGTSSSLDGSIKFYNANGTHTVSLQAPATDPASNLTFKLPSAYGSNGDCLQSDGSGGLSFSSCTGGAGGGVTSLNGQIGVVSIANASGSGGVVTLNDASTTGKGIAQFNGTNFSVAAGVVDTIQSIAASASPTFTGLTLSGFGSGLVVSNGSGLLSSGVIDRNSSTYFNNALSVANGGTGLTATPSNGQLLIGNGSGFSLATLSNSDGTVSITNGAGSISLSVPRADQCSTCADYTLSNLADIIAINKSLLPATAGAINLGGSSVPYSKLYLSGTSSTPASNNFTITGNASSARTINLPDADGTFCLLETCLQLQSSSPGTAQNGNINLNGLITASNLNLAGTATVNTLTPAAATGLVLGATGASQTTNLQGNTITFTNGSATYSFASSALGSQTICDTSGNCAGAGGGVIASGGSAYNLPVFTSSNTVTNSIIGQDAGATTATVSGILKVTGANITGTGALTLGSTGGSNALNLNSASGTLGLTGSTATIQRVGSSLTFDVNSASASTLTVTNSNASNVANLSVEGGVNIGSGQSYKINGTDINTAGTLNNVAYLNQNNTFTGTGNTSFAGTISGGTYNGQTISSSSAFTGTVSIAGANALTLGQASTNSGAIIFNNNAGSNTVTLKAANTNPASSFSLTLPAALGSTGDCLEQIDASGSLGFVGCAAGLGGSGTTGKIAVFTGGSAIGDSLLSQSGSTVALQGSGNTLQVDGSIVAGVNGASGNVGSVVFNDGSNPGRAVTVQSQQAGSSYTLQLPTSADVGSSCLVLSSVSAGVAKIAGGSCAAGGTGGNITATGTTNGHLLRATSDGPSYSAAASLLQDDGTGVGVNIAPQSGYVFTAGSGNKFKVTDAGQLEIGTTGSNPLTFATTGAISNVTTLTASGLLQTSASGQALSLTGAPTNSATQSLLRLGNAISGGNNVANGGTYIGLNAPASGAGSAADFLNFQLNGTSKLKVDNNGNITAGTYNGVTIGGSGALTSGGYTLTLTGNSTLNQNLTTTSAVQFDSLTLTNALTPANGGTGADTSGASAGAALLFNATTGKFEANQITSNDGSLSVNSSDGHIDLQVATCATCAKNDLSNLAATTNINSTLQAQNGVDIGSASNPFRNLYIYGSSSSPSSNHFQLTGTATSARTITLPDASGTVCLTGTCVTLQGSSHSPQTGYIDISNDLTVGGNFALSGSATVNTLAPAASTALVLGAQGASQTTTLQGNGVTFTDAGHSYIFSKAGSGTHTICDDTGNCAGAGGGALVSGGSAFYVPVFNNSNTLINSIISQDAGAGATTATVTGKLIVSATNTSGTSLSVSNSSLNTNNANLAQLSFTNANSGASSTAVNGLAITPTGSTNSNANANTLNGVKFNNVTPVTNNSFYALNVGTGYDDILRYNSTSLINGSGLIQNNAIDATLLYSNLTKLGTITVGTWQGSAIADAYVQDNLTVSSSGTVDWTALNNYPAACAAGSAVTQLGDTVTCSAFATGTAGSYIQNQNAGAQATSNYWISGTGRADTAVATPAVRATTDSTTGIQFQNAAGTTSVLTVDTTNARIGIGTTPSYKLHVTDSSTATSGTNVGTYLGMNATPASAPGATTSYMGAYTIGTSASANLNANTQLYGSYSLATNTGAATLGSAIGTAGLAQNAGSGTTSVAIGLQGRVSNTGSGSITTGAALAAAAPDVTAGSISTVYGLYVDTQKVSGVTTGYGIFQNGTNDLNVFNGKVGIGATPTANLQVTTGTNTATAFQVQNSSNQEILTADTASSQVLLGKSSALNGKLVFNNATNANQVSLTVASGTAAYALTLPSTAPSVSQCLKAGATTAGLLEWQSCSSANLQNVYDNSSSPATILLADGKNIQFTAQDTTTDPSIIMKLNCTACTTGATGNFLVQNNGGDRLFSIAGNGDITIGNATSGNTLTMTASGNYEPTLNGSARHIKKIVLTPEYAGAVLTSCTDATGGGSCAGTDLNSGTMTSAFDPSTSNGGPGMMSYYNWTSIQTNAQTYDVLARVPVPSDWSAWSGSNNMTVYYYDDNNTNTALSAQVVGYNGSSNSYDVGSSGTMSAVTLGTASQWNTATFSLTDAKYAKDGYITIRLRVSAKSSSNIRLGNISISYKTAY